MNRQVIDIRPNSTAWEPLDCRLMRVAAGDGIAADPASPFCAHYPGSGAEKIMDEASTNWVNTVGQALLNRENTRNKRLA